MTTIGNHFFIYLNNMTQLFYSINKWCRAARYLSGAVLFLLLCSCGQDETEAKSEGYRIIQNTQEIQSVKEHSQESNRVALNAQKIITISLPEDGPSMRFFPVWLGIDGKNRSAAYKSLGSHTASASLRDKEKMLAALPVGAFVGKRNDTPERLYYLGETEVQRGQWNSLISWMDKQEEKMSSITKNDRKNPKLPRTGVAMDEIYRFIEALNIWAGQDFQKKIPNSGRYFIFFRLPTEAEWDFAARGGINVLERNPECFTHRHPYKDSEALSKHEWCKENTHAKILECGSLYANPIGLKDMLGNVEEITTHLFSSEDKQRYFSQLVICGNSYKDSSADFNVSRRIAYFGGKEKVGFRIALGRAVRYGTEAATENEKQKFRHNVKMQDLKDELDRLKSKNEAFVNKLEQQNQELRVKEQKVEELRNKLITAELHALEERLKKAVFKVDTRRVRINALEQRVETAPDSYKLQELEQEIKRLTNENNSLGSHLKKFIRKKNSSQDGDLAGQQAQKKIRILESNIAKHVEAMRSKNRKIVTLNLQIGKLKRQLDKKNGGSRQIVPLPRSSTRLQLGVQRRRLSTSSLY